MHGRVLDVYENVQAYGAIGDGVVNDTAAIQACIDACSAAGGGVVYLPPGTYKVSQGASLNLVCLQVKEGVILRGAGNATVVKAAASLPSPVAAVIGNGISENPQHIGLEHFKIDGNRDNQTQPIWGGRLTKHGGSPFELPYPPDSHAVGSSGLFYVDRMNFSNCLGGGFHFTDTGVGMLTNCMAWNCGIGYSGLVDAEVIGCTAGYIDSNGFEVTSGSCRLVGCKAYACGRTDATKYGFSLTGTGQEVTACEVQESIANGFFIGGKSAIVSGGVDQISGSAVVFGSTATTSGNVVDLFYTDVGGMYKAIHLIDNTAGATYNRVTIRKNNNTGGPTGTIYAGTTDNNYFRSTNQDGTQIATYAASFTPYPAGGNQILTLTGPITINPPGEDAPVGSRLVFTFIQDGVGGRVVTWNAIWHTNWTPNTTAGHKNTIEFVYDGTNWLQTSYTAVAI
jgi:hypothetical protein